LDVVMETDDAGLRLIDWIRGTVQNLAVRIVIRTGQPGAAPEESVMERYDIHNYYSKTETTARRLRTMVLSAVRAWRDVRTVQLQRLGLEKVITATSGFYQHSSLEQLLTGILEQITALLVPREHALLFMARLPGSGGPAPLVLAASGRYAGDRGRSLSEVLDPLRLKNLEASARPGAWSWIGQDGVFGFDIRAEGMPVLYLEEARQLGEWERHLLSLFCASAGVAFTHQHGYEAREERQQRIQSYVPLELLSWLGASPERPPHQPIRRELVVVAVRWEGMSPLAAESGPVELFELWDRLRAALLVRLQAEGGTLFAVEADELVVLFSGSPPFPAVLSLAGLCRALCREVDRPGLFRLGVGMERGAAVMGVVGTDQERRLALLSPALRRAHRLAEEALEEGLELVWGPGCGGAALPGARDRGGSWGWPG
jgi:class 3 adenylate cyclase